MCMYNAQLRITSNMDTAKGDFSWKSVSMSEANATIIMTILI